MGALKHITTRQADVCEQVWSGVVGIDQRVMLLESRSSASAAAVALNSQGPGLRLNRRVFLKHQVSETANVPEQRCRVLLAQQILPSMTDPCSRSSDASAYSMMGLWWLLLASVQVIQQWGRIQLGQGPPTALHNGVRCWKKVGLAWSVASLLTCIRCPSPACCVATLICFNWCRKNKQTCCQRRHGMCVPGIKPSKKCVLNAVS